MSDGLPPEIRNAFDDSNPRPTVGTPTWDERIDIGMHPRFRNTQELRVAVVVKGGIPAVIQETVELSQGTESLKSWVLLYLQMIPGVLAGLLKADKQMADLECSPATDWPQLPLVCGEGKCGSEEVRVLVDAYNGRLEAKLSTTIAGSSSRNGRWAKLSSADIRIVGKLILQAYDHAKSMNSAPPSSSSPYDEEVPF